MAPQDVGPESARLTVSRGAAFASVRLARDGNTTTFRVHGRGLLVGLMVNELGIARTVTAAIKEAFRPVPGATTRPDRTAVPPARPS